MQVFKQPYLSRNRISFWSLFALVCVVAIIYFPALGLNFYADDYSFVEMAGRSSLGQYLAFYFDPRAQTGWYRPMQGMLFGLEWLLFGGNPIGYHAVNALVHLGNTLFVFAIVSRLSRSLRTAFLAALVWSGLPLYGVAVFWPGDADFLLTFFYLASIYCWVRFLHEKSPHWRYIAISAFVLAVLTKEFGATIPFTLLLIDRLLLRGKITPRALLARYSPFLAVCVVYLPLELYIQSRSVLTNEFGYGIGPQIAQNSLNYLAALAFPWILPEPINYLWLALALAAIAYVSFARRTIAAIACLAIAVVAFVPVIPFPWFFHRYLYSAAIISAVFISWLVRAVNARLGTRWGSIAVSAALAAIIFGNGIGTADATAEFAEIGRQTRVPFRDFSQRHSTIPSDTLIYFIDPPTITSQLSGMFFLRYGAGVRVSSDDLAGRANLRAHQAAYLVYFDSQKRTQEIGVEKDLMAQAKLAQPTSLLGWELANDHAKRGGTLALILYWDSPIEAQVKLVDARTGQAIADASGRTRGATADARMLVIPADAQAGQYRIEITAQEDSRKSVIEPIVVSE